MKLNSSNIRIKYCYYLIIHKTHVFIKVYIEGETEENDQGNEAYIYTMSFWYI